MENRNTVEDSRFSRLLDDLTLRPERLLDQNSNFLVMKCRNGSSRELVVKYSHSGSADAMRRIRNEAILTRDFPARAPLGFLEYVCHGDGYLVTKFARASRVADIALFNSRVVDMIAHALAKFQGAALDAETLGIVDREPLWWYYLKVTLKHIVHLCPDQLMVRDGLRALWHVLEGLPAITATSTACHADFLPTNLLYDDENSTVTFLDLEGYMARNHPLFDIVAFFTIDERPLEQWDWQKEFLQRYLEHSYESHLMDANSPRFAAAYRSILVFYLVYRLNESILLSRHSEYFDGLARGAYLRRKMLRVLGLRAGQTAPEKSPLIEIRKANLLRMLSDSEFRVHFHDMQSAKFLRHGP